MIDEELDVAVHPPLHHPLDPFADGKLVTRRSSDGAEIVRADQHILLACEFLWDVVANQHVFAPMGVVLRPPAPELALKANFNIAPTVSIAGLGVPTNNYGPMCQHWTLELSVGNRKVAYTIGSYRPSINAMEASVK